MAGCSQTSDEVIPKKYLKNWDETPSKIEIQCTEDADCKVLSVSMEVSCTNVKSINKNNSEEAFGRFEKRQKKLFWESPVKYKCKHFKLDEVEPICEKSICSYKSK